MILCADIGATKTLLGLARVNASGDIEVVTSHRYVAAEVGSFEAMLDGFLRDQAPHLAVPLRGACFGVAGPVNDGQVHMTNLSWHLDAAALSRRLGGIPVRLANDFEAAASGIDLLSSDQLLPLQAGQPVARAPQLVIGAGSGLGVAFRVWQPSGDGRSGRYGVVTGEGGHFSFTPANDEQDRALMRLRPHVVRPVVEHFVSGPGLANFYTFLDNEDSGKRVDKAPQKVATAMDTAGLTGEEVFRRAVDDAEPRALHALHHFLLSYGVVAGDYALATLARGGVFLAGGIAQKLGPLMRDGRFLVGFHQKGPYAPLMATMPVHVVTAPDLGLLGAAVIGARI